MRNSISEGQIRIGAFALTMGLALLTASAASAQVGLTVPPHPPAPGEQGSPNMEVASHIPLGARYSIGDVEIEQDPNRPYAYVSRLFDESGFDVIDLSNPDRAQVLYRWRIDDPELHQGRGGVDGKQFEIDGQYYYLQSFEFGQGGPDSDVAGIVFDVTQLPNTSEIREVRRFSFPDMPGGFHNIYTYKHSDGRALLFATGGPSSRVFDLERFIAGDADYGFVAEVPIEENLRQSGYHDFYVGFDALTGRDIFYGGGGEGYYAYDITDLQNPELLVTITGVPGVQWGHTFTPTPDGRYAVGETEYQYAPLRIFDMQPALDGETLNIDRAVGMWHADWKTVAHNHEVRWPYVFVSGYETGLVVFDMKDPTNPYTVAYYDTFDGPHGSGDLSEPSLASEYQWRVYDGAWGVDVRNSDGLIVVSDMTTGFWALRMENFDRWNGNDWGVPNISSAQHWAVGPEAAAYGGPGHRGAGR